MVQILVSQPDNEDMDRLVLIVLLPGQLIQQDWEAIELEPDLHSQVLLHPGEKLGQRQLVLPLVLRQAVQGGGATPHSPGGS